MRRAVLVAALLLAGCGSASPSARQFRLAATRICTSAAGRTARIAAPAVPSDAVAFLRRGIFVLTPELMRLRRLRPPRELASSYAAALAGFSGELGAIRSAMAALDRGGDPVGTVQALQHRLAPIEARTNAAWHALDLARCQSG